MDYEYVKKQLGYGIQTESKDNAIKAIESLLARVAELEQSLGARDRDCDAKNLMISSLEAENVRLKTVPMKYRRMQFNAELQDENTALRQQLLLAQAEIKRLREDQELLVEAWNYGQFADDFNQPQAKPVRAAIRRLCEALASPSDTSALDAYVAEKVKDEANVFRIEYGDLHDSYTAQKAQIATLTSQRDLAVAALEYKHDTVEALMSWCVKNVKKWDFPQYDNLDSANKKMAETLSTIKESEVADGA